MFKIVKTSIVSLFLILCSLFSNAQNDSLTYHLQSQTSFATQSYLPHYLLNNRYGLFNEEGNDGYLKAGIEKPYADNQKFSYGFGADLVAKPRLNQSFILQAYGKVKYGIFDFIAGRFEETQGTHTPALSTGSLALSNNAIPVPKLSIRVSEYENVPFTKGWLEFKGHFSHGWLGRERFMENALLHEKSLYAKTGKDLPVNAFAGLVHYTIWGGTHPSKGSPPQSFGDYFKIITGRNVNDTTTFQREFNNALGDHLGIINFGFEIHLKPLDINIYNQVPFEDGSGLMAPFERKDRLLGLDIDFKKPDFFIENFLYEFVHTTYQSGPTKNGPNIRGNGQDNYYNNAIYKTGWVYKDKILGNPLMLTQSQLNRRSNENRSYRFNVANNRVRAHHFGFKGRLSNLKFKVLSTFSKNFGNYKDLDQTRPDYFFKSPKKQNYFILETSYPLNVLPGTRFQLALAADYGAISKNYGFLMGIKYSGNF